MIPSPLSPLSSFRDYYQHSFSNQQFAANEQIYIQDGLRNFKIAKLFSKVSQKLKKQQFWLAFYAFKRLINHRQSSLIKKHNILDRLLLKKQLRQSSINTKCECLHTLLDKTEEQRNRQIYFCQDGLLILTKKYYSLLSSSFNRIKFSHPRLKTNKQIKSLTPKKLTKEEIKLHKISKAIRVIIIRHVFHVRIFYAFSLIRHHIIPTSQSKIQNSNIRFFKQKKQKIINIKSHNKYEKIQKVYLIQQFLNKKWHLIMKMFMRKLEEHFLESNQRNDMKDTSEITINFTKHMIYLTGIMNNNHRQRKGLKNLDEIRRLKLSFLVKKWNKKQKTYMIDNLIQWRKAANIKNLRLRKEILKLEELKKHYMEQI